MKKSGALVSSLIFLLMVLGSGSSLFAWDDFPASGFPEDCSDENVKYNDYSNNYIPGEYKGITGAKPFTDFSVFSTNNVGEDDFADDGGTDESENHFNDNLQLPLNNGLFALLLFAVSYSLYIRCKIRRKNNNVKQL